MSKSKAAFVLVHGGWHNHSAWDRVTPILKANGFAAFTLDLPGAGANAIAPTSLVFARSTRLHSPPSGHPSPVLRRRSGHKRSSRW